MCPALPYHAFKVCDFETVAGEDHLDLVIGSGFRRHIAQGPLSVNVFDHFLRGTLKRGDDAQKPEREFAARVDAEDLGFWMEQKKRVSNEEPNQDSKERKRKGKQKRRI